MKRIHNIDFKPILTDNTVPTGGPWDTKEPEIRQHFIWGAGPSAIEIITKRDFTTDPDTIKTDKLIQLFREYYMPNRNIYHSRGDFFWAKQEENETLEETLERTCEFKDIKQEDLLISKFITSITDKKLQKKLIREKTLNLKTTIELITQAAMTADTNNLPYHLHWRKRQNKNLSRKSKQNNSENNKNRRKTIVDFVDNKTGHPNTIARVKR